MSHMKKLLPTHGNLNKLVGHLLPIYKECCSILSFPLKKKSLLVVKHPKTEFSDYHHILVGAFNEQHFGDVQKGFYTLSVSR